MKYPDANDVITGNGYGSRMVIAVNRKFPGPAITAYKNQKIIVLVPVLYCHGMDILNVIILRNGYVV
jgi:hypothetical protein